MAKNNLIVDGQLFQTGAWHRGMAKLTVSVIAGLLDIKKFGEDWELTVVLSSNIDNTERVQEIAIELPGAEVIELDLMIPAGQYAVEKKHNMHVLDTEVSSRNKKFDSVHFMIPALFEHSVLPVFPEASVKHIIFHDLIPLLFPHYYLRTDEQKDFYFSRFPELFAADRIFANSVTTGNDLVTYLGISPDVVTVINGAGYTKGRDKSIEPEALKGSKRPFILMPTGDDARKNNARCVEAFAVFNKLNGNKYDLVLTSNFGLNTQSELRKYAKNVIFTGIVSDEGMNWLIEKADVVLFGPEYEGLGMPLLEATEKNKRIVCSAISVFKEISSSAYTMFDPYDVDAIAQALTAACLKKEPDAAEYKSILAKYSWKHSAEAMFSGLSKTHNSSNMEKSKKKIAVLTPNPRGYSTIGKYIQELHPALSAVYDVDYYLEDHPEVSKNIKPSYLEYVATTFDVAEFNAERYAQYDEVWYNVGNSEYHLQTVTHALNLPGLLILHDTRLKGMFDCLLRRGRISPKRYEVEELLNAPNGAESITTLVNSSKGVIVHSSDAREKAKDILLAPKAIRVAGLSIPHPAEVDVMKSEGGKRITVGFAGILTAEKGIKLLNELLSDTKLESCNFEVFGFNFASGHAILHDFKDNPRVQITTNLNDLEFQEKLQSLDVLVNYRANYFGETSRLTIEAMRYGVCTIVRRIGWFDELPEDAVAKLDNEDGVIRVIENMLMNPEKLKDIQSKAKQYVADNCSPTAYVADMGRLSDEASKKPMSKDTTSEWAGQIAKQSIPDNQKDKLLKSLAGKDR